MEHLKRLEKELNELHRRYRAEHLNSLRLKIAQVYKSLKIQKELIR